MPTVTNILKELEKPGRDPRPSFQTATFAEGVNKLADLEPGMRLEGVVTNVAAFGAFVDVGVHQDGLVHVSAMSKNFVNDPREVVKSGEVVTVKVVDVDVDRKRISLTLRLDDEVGGGPPGERGSANGGAKGESQNGGPKGGGQQGGGQKNGGPKNGGGPKGGGSPKNGDPKKGGKGQKRDGGGKPGKQREAPSGAMADALRRAGFGDQ